MEVTYLETDGESADSTSNGRGLLTVAQVSQLLNVHPHSVRRWADMGLLPCYRLGLRGDRRFNAGDVEVFLKLPGRKSA